jgi:RNA polymerase sigma factor (sigma-70 family)
MFGAANLTDDVVRAGATGTEPERGQIVHVLEPQVRLMVAARLSPTAAQLHAVDEVTQEVLLALADGLSRLKARSVRGLKAFVSGIVAHKVADLLRGRGSGDDARPALKSLDSTVAALSTAGPLWQFLSSSGVSPSSAIVQKEQAARLLSELGGLNERHRQVITLAFFDQLSMAEVAAEMGVSPPAASMLLLRAIRALRQNMTGAGASGVAHGRRSRG